MVCLRISAKRSLHSAGRPFIATREAIHSMSARGLPDYWSLLKPQPRSDPQIGVFSVEGPPLGVGTGRVRRHVRSRRKPTPHSKDSKAHPLVNRLNLA